MANTITKRSGQTVSFNSKKIFSAIEKAAKEIGEMKNEDINQVTMEVVVDLSSLDNVQVETVQDTVELKLAQSGFYRTAKAYVLYRQRHRQQREASMNLMDQYKELLFMDAGDLDLKRDNANINADAPMGIMLKLGTEGAKTYADHYAIPEKYAKADKENFIHIHDKDFSFITFNCCQIDLGKLLKAGFSTGHGFLREPNSIRAAASLACIAIQSNQNDMFGGQSINALDFALAPYVKKSFKKHYRSNLAKAIGLSHAESNEECHMIDALVYYAGNKMSPSFIPGMGCSNPSNTLESIKADVLSELEPAVDKFITQALLNTVWCYATRDTEDEIAQAMEAMIHNFNTLHSRAGAQVPFSSINYGLDTSIEGQLIIDKTLDAIWNGLGHGETPIFPISVFQIKSGVNYNPGDPNYELFQKACKVSAKRLFPNFVNIDAPYNLQYYKPGNPNATVATMGCRTRVMSNVNGPEESGSRGNFAFTTINLPKLALEAKGDLKTFWKLYDEYIKLSKEYLEYRYEIIAKKHVYNFPFLMEQHVWMDSEKLKPTDEIREVLKHASISIGFCGLAECLVALTGSHHGASKDAQELGLKIVGHLREMTDKFSSETHMNWTTFGTPAESTAGSFQRSNQKTYGIVPGVTDREYMTNSSHVPVYYPIKAIDKIRVEAPYHALENAGHIAYIEINGDPTKNVKAFEQVVRAMHDANMGYFSINHPVDRDPICGYTGVIENECPHCHRREDGTYSFVIKRIK